ncbi:MAG: peptidylprolyl isomerase [Candidatus Wallbacteria bacterium]|nr:peptidylprolyl isomerase [Candidatus Wallbacteria bacterium]
MTRLIAMLMLLLTVCVFADGGTNCVGGVCQITPGSTKEAAATGEVKTTAEVASTGEVKAVTAETAVTAEAAASGTVKEPAESNQEAIANTGEVTMDIWGMIAKRSTSEAIATIDKGIAGDFKADRARTAISKDWPVVKISTDKGDIYAALYEDDAPNTVASFIYLIDHQFYNGLKFHRVVKNFVIQGGDPDGNGSGGPGYEFGLEISDKKHEEGVLSMARTSDPNSNGSQFFITHTVVPHLDGQYTAFGCVLLGQDVVNKIVQGDKMNKLEIIYKRAHDYIPKTVSGKLKY